MEKELPKSWIHTNLENIFNLSYGKGLSTKELSEEGFSVYGANGVIGKFNRYNYEIPKVIISCRGAASGAIHKTSAKSFVTSNSIVLDEISPKALNVDYVKYAMCSLNKEEVITGTAQPQITIQLLKNLQFPLIPLAEQNRIVAKLDKFFQQLEVINTSLEKIPVLLKNFRQQVLTQAVTGKLTEEWRKGKILKAPVLLNEKNEVEFQIIKYFELPPSWIKTSLGNCAQISRGKFTARPRNDPKYFLGRYPFMQIGDLPRQGGAANLFSKTLNEEGKKVSKSFPKDTVVIAIVGATIGNTGILTQEMFFPDSLIGINTDSTLTNKYIEFHLRICKYGLREISYAGGGQPNIKIPTVKNLEIALPSFEEQGEIINRVESFFHKADAIELQYKSLKNKIENLPQSILHKAFKGELVPQLETDGDARELMEEIEELKKEVETKSPKVKRQNKKYGKGDVELNRAAEGMEKYEK